ncbi:hypothetical protein EV643_1444 [Kribbella sp. VKM Ac-2527]|uniref:Uncharacterized protein n=1 Tax=Kribbella caucasensis TaxID=2512215 RepID=A0A4R6J638_9ACTN|nr:hypothetical protein [Kribbella sp. VKM Ac-2527]TDO29806.1 hypothetical protein EV643_1444 [Kribbella sp. VKM Ac-2527]
MSKESVGSVAEEAAKLFAVLQQATHTQGEPAGEKPHEQPDEVPAGEKHEHSLGPDCQWCPVCQLIHRVRNTSPETIEHLSAAAAGVLGSVRSLLEAAAEAARQARVDAEARVQDKAQQDKDGPARSSVDRIDVSEDPEPWD